MSFMNSMYEEGRGSVYDSPPTRPKSRPKSRPTEVPKEDEEKGFFQSLADLFTGGNDSPAPVYGGRGNVVESRNERSNYNNDVVAPSPVSYPDRPQIYDDVLGTPSDDNVFSTRYNPNTENFDVIDNPNFMNTRNRNDITSNFVQYVPPNMREGLKIGGQYGRSIPHALIDNIGGLFSGDSIGLDDGYQSFGEDLGAYMSEDPIGLGTDIMKGLGEGLYNLFTDSSTIPNYFRDVYGAATRDQTNRTADQTLGDLFTAGSIIPAVGGAKILGKAAYNSNVGRGFRGDLADDFYGPDGPQVAPNVGGLKVPERSSNRESLNAHYDFLKASGLSDYEIESEYGIKAYQTTDPTVPRVVGNVKPSSEVDVSNEPYTLEYIPRRVGGLYRPANDEVVINTKYNPNPSQSDDILRHEVEHRKQRGQGVDDFKFGAGGPEYSFKLQEKRLEDLNAQIRQETDQFKKQELITERDDIAKIDAGGSYYNSPIERGARQAELDPFNTYDPSIKASELLDPRINPNKSLLGRIDDSISRAVLPTHSGLSRFREMGPRIPFTNEKLLKGLTEAMVPLANMNTPQTPSTRGNQPVPFISGPDGSVDQALYSQPKTPSLADDIQKNLDYLFKKAPVVEYENQKAQMMAGGISGAKLQSNLDNLARNLGIERTDK